jgi:hypothetical protein
MRLVHRTHAALKDWAGISINKRTLTVHMMRVTDTGGYIIQAYDWALQGTRMRLKFTNLSNGKQQRQVNSPAREGWQLNAEGRISCCNPLDAGILRVAPDGGLGPASRRQCAL